MKAKMISIVLSMEEEKILLINIVTEMQSNREKIKGHRI